MSRVLILLCLPTFIEDFEVDKTCNFCFGLVFKRISSVLLTGPAQRGSKTGSRLGQH